MTTQGKKKGGGGSTPTESPDSLRSTQIAEVVLLVGEGEIRGLVNGMKSVYLDGVPVENQDGSQNFSDVDFAYVPGTPGQAALPGISSVQSEVAVGLAVNQATPIVRAVGDNTADELRITISVAALTELKVDTGNLVGSSFVWAVDVQSNGAGWVERYRGEVTGKATARYSRSVRVPLLGNAPWDVRVRRISPDAATSNITNAFSWDSFTILKNVKLRYPHSAVAMLRVNAKSFTRIPTIGLDVLGQVVPVPSNYNPLTRVYSGGWDGTFRLDWTVNPAWIFHDLLTHERYGLGKYFSAALVNKWALYTIAQYCDQLVPDGRGGQEPRFTCSAVINTRQEAFTLLQELAAVFRGISFWANSAVDFAQDAPGEAELLYTPANVVGGEFQYADTNGERDIHSVFIVRYNDLQQLGKQVAEVYADPDMVQRYGHREKELTAFGCWSRGQAARVARWAAYSEQYEPEVVSFAVGADGAAARPGRLFKVADPTEAGARLGGRIRSATAGAVTLDAPVTLEPGETYTLSVLQPVAGQDTGLVAEKRTVSNTPGQHQVLQVTPAFSAAPAAHTVWLLEGTNVEATWWRCLAVEETSGEGGKTEYRINGVRHLQGKYSFVELGIRLDPRPISVLSLVPKPPTDLVVSEEVYLQSGEWRIRASVGWVAPQPGLGYRAAWRINSGSWTEVAETNGNSLDVEGLQPGLFEVKVQSTNALGRVSPAVQASLLLEGYQGTPPDVTGLTYAIVPGGVRLAWDPVSDPAKVYAKTRLSYGATFAGSVFFWEGNSSDFVVQPPAAGTYMVWAVHYDRLGTPSQNPAGLEVVYEPAAAGSDGLSSADVILYQRSVSAPNLPSSAVTYRFSNGDTTGMTEGWEPFIPQGGGPLWVIKARAIAPASILTDSIGTSEWPEPVILVTNGLPGGFRKFIFQRAASLPATPVGDFPENWFDSPPPADGGTLYTALGNFTAANTLVGVWSAPLRLEGDGVEVQFSVNGVDNWHSPFEPGDVWGRQRVGSAGEWSIAYKIVGEDGLRQSFIFIRSSAQPDTPEGVSLPAGWSDQPPAPNTAGDPLWVSLRSLNAAGQAVGPYTTPVRIEGAGLQVEYSVNGINGWHPVFAEGDVYARYRTGPDGPWSGAVKIVGEDGVPGGPGPQGPAGGRTVTLQLYRWSSATPTTFPQGLSLYDWASGQWTVPGTPNGWAKNPGPPASGQSLYVVEQPYVDSSTAQQVIVAWSQTTARVVGAAGTVGLNGSVTGYSRTVAPPVYSTAPWNGASDDANASLIVFRMRGGSGSPPNQQHLVIGDTVTLSNSAQTLAATRFWNGSAWAVPGAIFPGEVLVGGTIGGQTNLNIAGFAKVEGGAGLPVVAPIDGSTALTRTAAITGNTTGRAQDYGVVGYTLQSAGGGAGVYGVGLGPTSWGVAGRGAVGVYGSGATYGMWGAAQSAGAVGVYGSGVGSGWGLFSAGRSFSQGQLRFGMNPSTEAPMVLPLITGSLPPVVDGGFAAHLAFGLIVSINGQWFRLNTTYVAI